MKIKYYSQRQQVEQGFLEFNYVPSTDNAIDGFIKLYSSLKFKIFRDDLIYMTINMPETSDIQDSSN